MLDELLREPHFAASEVCATLRSQPLGFVDVGARGGVHELVEPLAGVTAVLGFEPDAEECARLAGTMASGPWAAVELAPHALAAEPGRAVLHLLSAPTNHSLRPPSRPFTGRYGMVKFREVGQTTVPTIDLDRILFGTGAPALRYGELLKLDTQGTEYEVLLGARRTLAERTVAVLVEVSFCQIYEGQRTFSDVDLLLRAQGFSFYGFATFHHRSRRQLDKRVAGGRERALWADAVFFKDPLPGGPAPVKLDGRAQQVLFACALLFGYHDFALELARETWASGAEAERVAALVEAWAARSPEQAVGEVEALWQRVRSQPGAANIEVGRFVDRRRSWCDYDDVPPAGAEGAS